MRSLRVVVPGKLCHELVQVPQPQHDEAVQALLAEGLDEALAAGVEVGGEAGEHLARETHPGQAAVKPRAQLAVAVTEDDRPAGDPGPGREPLGLLAYQAAVGA